MQIILVFMQKHPCYELLILYQNYYCQWRFMIYEYILCPTSYNAALCVAINRPKLNRAMGTNSKLLYMKIHIYTYMILYAFSIVPYILMQYGINIKLFTIYEYEIIYSMRNIFYLSDHVLNNLFGKREYIF